MKRAIVSMAAVILSLSCAAGADERPAQGLSGAVEMTNSLARVHAFVSGRVQGVGFRNFTASKAVVLKLKGWVKNLTDGRVELVAEGPAADVEKLMDAVATGPGGARVDKVERIEEPYKGEFKRFVVDR